MLRVREHLNAVDVDCFLVGRTDLARGVVGVLDLHFDVGGLVDGNTGQCFFARANSHVQLERGVHLLLAVLDTGLFGDRLGAETVGVDTVKVAATEEELGQGCLHDSFAFVIRVLGPRASGLSH